MNNAVFADVDRTLLFDGVFEPETREAIERIKKDHTFVLATGRRERRYQELVGVIPHDHAIYESGCVLRVNGEINEDWDAYVGDHRSFVQEAQRVIGCEVDWKTHSFVIRVQEQEISRERAEEIRGLELDGVCLRFNQGKYIDVFPEAAGKDNASLYLGSLLGVSVENTYAIGDDDNDMDLFRVCRHLYAPGNATRTVKSFVAEKKGFVSRYGNHQGIQDVLGRIPDDMERDY
tara:strand:+ start:5226 stop:5924 length:699 start_codon:yes stop_codon:yes gene_type:complete